MKTKAIISAMTLLFSLSTILTFANAIPSSALFLAKWEKLGMKKVNYKADRDEINVGVREGQFTALKLVVRKGGINLQKVAVHFGNGDVEELELRNDLPRGGESRVLDLPGNTRVIEKVVLWYDTKNYANQRAEVALWGRH